MDKRERETKRKKLKIDNIVKAKYQKILKNKEAENEEIPFNSFRCVVYFWFWKMVLV